MDKENRQIVHVHEELLYVDAYLYIIKERFGKRINITKEIDASLLNESVPRLILQPVIENAIEHGASANEVRNIVIRTYKEGNILYFEIENSGALSKNDEERIKSLLNEDSVKNRKSLSVGIKNVNERLKMIYGDGSGLCIFVNENGNTLSRITIVYEE